MSQALIVLGMHRSGTSAVAGVLARLGGAAPRTLMPAHADNPKGYWESAPLVHLNDRILAAAGSVWHDWRPIDPRWFDGEVAGRFVQEAAQALRHEFPGDAPAVLKDPRICRLFPLWRRALDLAGRQPIVISPLRRPAEVARSLARRDGFTLERANLIWLRHVLEAEQATREVPRLICRWSDVLSDWRGVIERFGEETGARLQIDDERAADVDAFLDVELRRNRETQPVAREAAEWIAPAFDALARLERSADDQNAKRQLDGIRGAFDQSAAIYGPVFAGLDIEYAAFHLRFAPQLADAANRAASAEAEHQRLTQVHLESQQAWAEHTEALAQEIQSRDERLKALEATERHLRQELQTTSEALVSAEQAGDQMGDQIRRLDRERGEAQDRADSLALAVERHKADALQARKELKRILARRRGRPMRTAWAVLRGHEA